MKVVVYQSFRGPPPPAWILRCMDTVRAWAGAQGYDYTDELDLFEFAPQWFKDKAGHICPIADLARLRMAQHLLGQGYDCAIWLDADVVIYNPEAYSIDLTPAYSLCREVWVGMVDDADLGVGELYCDQKVTNSMAQFRAGTPFLERYIETCLQTARETPGKLHRTSMGTAMLTEMWGNLSIPLHDQLGMFSPVFKHGLLEGMDEILDLYAASMVAEVHAANLCFVHRDMVRNGVMVDDALFERTIDRLMVGRGEEFNARYRRLAAEGGADSAGR